MSELSRLLTSYDLHKNKGKTCALATVTQVEGSSYRRPGARMLVTEDGQLTGSISGGCLEGDALRRARKVMLTGISETIIYDSTDIEEDLQHGAQLGCEGTIHILIEPLNYGDQNNPVELLRLTARQDDPVVLITILSDNDQEKNLSGRRFLVEKEKTDNIISTDYQIDIEIKDDTKEAFLSGQSFNKSYQSGSRNINVFMELILPSPRLTIYGAGNDVKPLANSAVSVGWRVHIIDGRAQQATATRFPQVESVTVVKIDELSSHHFNPGFTVLMSHNYFYDLAALKKTVFLDDISYIGILGPKKKTVRLLNDLQESGVKLDIEQLRKIYGPIGLNIGAETAEEIAVSVMGELLAFRYDMQAGFLRDLDGPIHNRKIVAATTF